MNFKKKFTPLEQSRMRIEVNISKKNVAEFYQNVLQKYAKTVQIPGFRKGKVPPAILENKYKLELCNEAENDLINAAIEDVQAHGDRFEAPLPYAAVRVDKTAGLDPQKDFSFSAEYDVFPKADIKNIEGFEIELPDVAIEEEDIQWELKELQERNALVVDKEEGAPAEEGNIATLKYAGLGDDGKEIEGTERDDFVFTIGSDEDYLKLSESVIGMKVGETKDIEKPLPANHPAESAEAKSLKMRITLIGLKKKELPTLDDEFAQDVSEEYKTFDDLKNGIRKNFERELEERLVAIKRDALFDKILEANTFELPQSMIMAELEARWAGTANLFRMEPDKFERFTLSALGSDKSETLSNWRPDAENRLKKSIARQALITQMEIDASEEDVEKEIEKIAKRDNTGIDEVKKHYASDREKEYLIEDIKEQRLFDKLFEKCSIKKGMRQSYKKFLNDIREKELGNVQQEEPLSTEA